MLTRTSETIDFTFKNETLFWYLNIVQMMRWELMMMRLLFLGVAQVDRSHVLFN